MRGKKVSKPFLGVLVMTSQTFSKTSRGKIYLFALPSFCQVEKKITGGCCCL